jgi:tetratricopeptide (TPR) repeat protein
MAISIPDTLQATLMARLDRLPSAKTIAQVGSVVGREFSHVLLAAAASMPDEQLMDGLDELSGSGLLFRRGTAPDAVYTFKHALVRDVVYASLPRQPRQHLHQMIGEALRDQFPERSESEPELIAHHFEQAGLGELAVDWWSKAGDLALQRFAMIEAVAHLERALELAEQLEDAQERRLFRARLQISYGNALRVVRGYAAPETKAAFAIARSLAMPLPQAPERFSAEYGLWSASFLSGDLSSMRELADAFLHNTEGRPASPETVVAHRLDGMTRWFIGNFHDAQSQLERAIACYDSERDMPMAIRFGQDLVVPAMIYSAISLWAIGSETAAARFDESVAHALRTEHVPTIAYTHLHGGSQRQNEHWVKSCSLHVVTRKVPKQHFCARSMLLELNQQDSLKGRQPGVLRDYGRNRVAALSH